MRLFLFAVILFTCQQGWGSTLSKTISSIPLKRLDGSPTSLSSLNLDKPMYIKFWASWCQPCVEQMPHFQSVQDAHGKEIEVVAVNIDINDDRQQIEEVRKRNGLSMPVLVDHTGRLAQAFDLIGTPYHVLVNADGEVVHTGHNADQALDEKLKRLAKGQSPEKAVATAGSKSADYDYPRHAKSAVLFTATWCDWYLEESRPSASQNCRRANEIIDELARAYPDIVWQIIVSRLWTGQKDLREYREKYGLMVPASIDTSNEAFIRFGVKDYPTLILFKDGKEVKRIERFYSANGTIDKIKQFK